MIFCRTYLKKKLDNLIILLFLLLYVEAHAQKLLIRHKQNPDYYEQNPFLQNTVKVNISKKEIVFGNNPFLQKLANIGTTRNNVYQNNPFLNGGVSIDNTRIEKKPPKMPAHLDIDVRIKVEDNIENMSYNNICGKPMIKPLIAGGRNIERGEYPWIAALHHIINNEKQIEFRCGASLLTDRHVITAAHCIKQQKKVPNNIIIFLGRTNISTNSYTIDINNGVIDGKTVYIHPKYESPGAADIGIVLLTKSVKFTQYIRPICLWQKYSTSFSHITDFVGYVAGWGYNENGDINLDGATMIRMPIVGKDKCLRSNEQFYNLVTENTFCAGYRDKTGPCRGDSGSALALKLTDNIWYLRGIVSAVIGEGACNFSNYIVFVDAAKYIEWIKEMINKDTV